MNLKHTFFLAAIAFLSPAVICSCANTGEAGEDEALRALSMQEFVEEISAYARSKQKGFIVIPQNGSELAFNNAAPDDGFRDSYINAIDGIGIEELFYDRILKPDAERIAMLRKIKTQRPALAIMVSDIVSDNAAMRNALQLCKDEGFLAFPRSSGNEDYRLIPGLPNGNDNDVSAPATAQNYLYLISDASYRDKTAMLTAIGATGYDLVLLDLFFRGKDDPFTKPETDRLKKKHNGKKRLVLAYMSVGSAEKYRFYWREGWKKGNPPWIKKNYPGYPGEYWVEYWNAEWRNIVFDYIDKILEAGFDGVYLDNVEAYYFIGR